MQTIDYTIFKLEPGDRVLDLGCGEGRHALSIYMSENVESIGVDLCHSDLLTAQQRFEHFVEPENNSKSLSLSVANAMNLPFADNTFDKVICSEVLEHIPDYRAVLEEIDRILKPGGVFAASVPSYWPERICWLLSYEYHAVEGGHIRIFRARELRKDIEKLGMQHYRRHWAHALHVPFWWLKCLFWQKQDDNWLIKLYHRLLVWDTMRRPWITQWTEKLLNPLMGKSVVMYFDKGAVE